HRRRLTDTKKLRSNGGHAIEQTRKGKWLIQMNVRSAETRNVAYQAKAEMVIEKPETGTDDCFRGDRPGQADARRDVVGFLESGCVVPTKSAIHRQAVSNPPIVLNPQAIVVVT